MEETGTKLAVKNYLHLSSEEGWKLESRDIKSSFAPCAFVAHLYRSSLGAVETVAMLGGVSCFILMLSDVGRAEREMDMGDISAHLWEYSWPEVQNRVGVEGAGVWSCLGELSPVWLIGDQVTFLHTLDSLLDCSFLWFVLTRTRHWISRTVRKIDWMYLWNMLLGQFVSKIRIYNEALLVW